MTQGRTRIKKHFTRYNTDIRARFFSVRVVSVFWLEDGTVSPEGEG